MLSSATVKEEVKKRSADILSSLFEETPDHSSSRISSLTVDASPHTTDVYCFPSNRKLSLQCAYLSHDKLIVIAKKEHLILVEVYDAASHFQLGEHQLPTFSTPLFSMDIGSLLVHSNSPSIPGLPYRPPLSLICSRSSWVDGRAPVPITDVFFRQLFGFELSLARSTVGLIGCHSGNVLFFDIRGYCNPCSTAELHALPNTLCCLDQPLVAIHPLHLPRHSETVEGGVSTSTANALLLVGRFGKMVLFTEAEEGIAAPQVTEFHVPSPILSSYVAMDHCVVFSTTSGIQRICLEPQCILNNDQCSSATTPVVPQSQFRFPVKMCSGHMCFITDLSSEPTKGTCSVGAVSIYGRVFRSLLKSCQLTLDVPEGVEIGRKMKECMSAAENTNERIITAQSRLKKVNSALIELNEALSTLLSMQSSNPTHKPFSCTIHPASEKVGVHGFTVCAEVELIYSGVATLQRGWTLSVTTQCTTSSRSKFTTFSLVGLATGSAVKHRIPLEPECALPLTFTIAASICYSTAHLQSTSSPCRQMFTTPLQMLSCSTGVSVTVDTCVLDALDFFQPHSGAPLQLVQYTHMPNISIQQSHSFEISLPRQLVSSLSDSSSLTSAEECRDVLRMFLPCTVTGNIAFTANNRTAQVQACTYDGSIVSFQVSDKEGSLKLDISATRASCMVEVISGTRQRILKKGAHMPAISSLQVCSVL